MVINERCNILFHSLQCVYKQNFILTPLLTEEKCFRLHSNTVNTTHRKSGDETDVFMENTSDIYSRNRRFHFPQGLENISQVSDFVPKEFQITFVQALISLNRLWISF